jgi:hypothetical protein
MEESDLHCRGLRLGAVAEPGAGRAVRCGGGDGAVSSVNGLLPMVVAVPRVRGGSCRRERWWLKIEEVGVVAGPTVLAAGAAAGSRQAVGRDGGAALEVVDRDGGASGMKTMEARRQG